VHSPTPDYLNLEKRTENALIKLNSKDRKALAKQIDDVLFIVSCAPTFTQDGKRGVAITLVLDEKKAENLLRTIGEMKHEN
jgi:hypothetical protein